MRSASDLGVGLGVIARSKSYASISNAVKLPGYARVDAALFYKLSSHVQAQLNVENLLGAHYFPTASNDNNIAPGAAADDQGDASATGSSAASSSARFLDPLEVADEQRALLVAAVLGSGMRSRKLGWTVTQHSPPSASFSGSPRTLPMVTALPISDRAAVAPRATVTGGRISSRSCSIHQRHASISPASGLLWMRFLPFCTNLKCLTALVT